LCRADFVVFVNEEIVGHVVCAGWDAAFGCRELGGVGSYPRPMFGMGYAFVFTAGTREARLLLA
jgi:hypothetical protein